MPWNRGGRAAQVDGYNPHTYERAANFNGVDGRLVKTFANNGDRKKWCLTGYVRNHVPDTACSIFECSPSATVTTRFVISIYGQFGFYHNDGATDYGRQWTANRRDLADYQFILNYDSAEADAAQRLRLLLNGTLDPNFTDPWGAIPQDFETYINSTMAPHYIGYASTGVYGTATLTDIQFLDGVNIDDASAFLTDFPVGQSGHTIKAPKKP